MDVLESFLSKITTPPTSGTSEARISGMTQEFLRDARLSRREDEYREKVWRLATAVEGHVKAYGPMAPALSRGVVEAVQRR